MDSKFYVSLEAARLLKEKGYRQTYHAYYFGNSNLRKGGYRGDSWYDSPDFYPAPTKAEAIDWLESKGILISPHPVTILREDGTTKTYWSCYILQKGIWYKTNNLTTRLEAEEAAIIKACELL